MREREIESDKLKIKFSFYSSPHLFRKQRKKLTRPFEKYNLFVSNEAWSEFQGWVEGSLEAAEVTLEQMRLSPIC